MIEKSTSFYQYLSSNFNNDQSKKTRYDSFFSELNNFFDFFSFQKTLNCFYKEVETKVKLNFDEWGLFCEKMVQEQNKITSDFYNNQSKNNLDMFGFISNIHDFNKKSFLNFISQWSSNKDVKRKMNFFVNIFFDACSPFNNPFVNPSISNKMIKKGMSGFEKVLNRLIQDICFNQENILFPKAQNQRFKIGENIASSHGNVLYENRFCQLIHYQSKKHTTYKNPLLIVPSWINKYYIFDLSKENSMIQWLLNNGFEVFIISWVNPKDKNQDASLDDYTVNGLVDIIQWMQKKLDISSVNLIGYCAGGSLCLCLTSYFNLLKQPQFIKSITLIASPIDFSYLDEVGAFVCEEYLEKLKSYIHKNGIINGRYIGLLFSLLRYKDLIWPNFVSHYFLGEEENIIDFIFWSYDCINIPGTLQFQYLKNIFYNNIFMKKEPLIIKNKSIKVSTIQQPIYIVSFERDHIIPPRSSFEGINIFSNATFVLGGAGHVAGAINHPRYKKYNYKICSSKIQNYDEWLSCSQFYEGSWWIHWLEWIKQYKGEGQNLLSIPQNFYIEKAPGRFAMSD